MIAQEIARMKRKMVDSIIKRSTFFEQLKEQMMSTQNLPYENLGIQIPQIVSFEKTVSLIRERKASLCRFGDGEFSLMLGKSIPFQQRNGNLQKLLKEALTCRSSNLLIGIPDVFSSLDFFSDSSKSFWRKYMTFNRYQLYEYLDFEYEYQNAFISRPNNEFIYKSHEEILDHFGILQGIWDNQDCVLVEGGKEGKSENNIFDNMKTVTKIVAPSRDAFGSYKEILSEIKKNDKSKLIIISLGPTATILAYLLAQEGYQAIDIGHINKDYNQFLLGIRSGAEHGMRW